VFNKESRDVLAFVVENDWNGVVELDMVDDFHGTFTADGQQNIVRLKSQAGHFAGAVLAYEQILSDLIIDIGVTN